MERLLSQPCGLPEGRQSGLYSVGEKRMADRLPLIEHDPDEPPRDTSKSPWLRLLIILSFIWVWMLYSFDIVWLQVGAGFMTGGALACWAIDITGNKVPKSWRGGLPGPGSR